MKKLINTISKTVLVAALLLGYAAPSMGSQTLGGLVYNACSFYEENELICPDTIQAEEELKITDGSEKVTVDVNRLYSDVEALKKVAVTQKRAFDTLKADHDALKAEFNAYVDAQELKAR